MGLHRVFWLALLSLLGCKSTTDAGQADRHQRRGAETTCTSARARAPGRTTSSGSRKRAMHPRHVCEKAIGSTAKLPGQLRRAFDPGVFELLPQPGPHDWLANHPEPGQTYEQFVASGPTPPDRKRRRIDLLPVGSFAPKSSPPPATLVDYATTFFGIESRLLPAARLDDLSARTRKNRQTGKRQLFTLDILDALKKQVRPDAFCLQAITMEDLYPDPQWNFVFGQASLTDRVGVYSFARYDPAFFGEPRTSGYLRTLLRRSLKVMVHEIGHMFGLRHCVFFRCAMNGSNHLAESDARPMHLCPICLRKLHHLLGVDPVDRYRRLETFYRRHGFPADADFVANRVTAIIAP